MSVYDSYDYWHLDDDWFVAGYAMEGRVAAQFRPTHTQLTRAIENLYRGNETKGTYNKLAAEKAWHKEQGELV
jgi:hypothetical protein